MSQTTENSAPSDLARGRLAEAARARREEREARIVGLLNRGVAVAEIAAREGVSLKRMRNCIRELLAKREPQPPAAFLAEASRLEQALLVPFSAMANGATGAESRGHRRGDRDRARARPLPRVLVFGMAARRGARRRRPLLAPPCAKRLGTLAANP